MKSFFLHRNFFVALGVLSILFALSFPIPFLFWVATGLSALFFIVFVIEIYFLYRHKQPLSGERVAPNVLSLSDENTIILKIINNTNLKLKMEVIDELPLQLEDRSFAFQTELDGGKELVHRYPIRPMSRGKYGFGYANCLVSVLLHFVKRRIRVAEPLEVAVFPSIIQMKELELKTLASLAIHPGIKKLRRLGHSYEFEQIKHYQKGDDIRSINWKASSRRNELMINQFEDERSQQIYSIIDKSRVMKLPFNGLTLMDYAINTSLAIANIILKKHDKAGLISFSDRLGSVVPASESVGQLRKIMHALYSEKERKGEANYELLLYSARKLIRGRSMILLYSNFESMFALERVLPILRKVNKHHLLVVVLFINTEIENFADKEPETTKDLYIQTIAEKFLYEKRMMVRKLQQYGIQTIFTRPEDLSLNSINKYLELKARGLI